MTSEVPPGSPSFTGALLGGRYRIGRLLGVGGMGMVYQATREDLGGRRVAVKLLHPSLTGDASLLVRFRREAEVVAALGHPNIVAVTDLCALPDEPVFFVMELLDGKPLSEVLAVEGALAPGRAAFIATQVLSALGAAHAARVVHRDLKPDNVFLTTVSGLGDVVKLLDFGVAKLGLTEAAQRLTRTGSVFGTPAYMAPEQARGLDVDERADLHAVGVLLYEMLAGRTPFSAPTYNALLFTIVGDPPEPLGRVRPGLPDGLVEAVARAMAKDPAGRFPDAAAMAEAIAPWVEAGPVRPTSVGTAARSGDRPLPRGPEAEAARVAPTRIASQPPATVHDATHAPTRVGNPIDPTRIAAGTAVEWAPAPAHEPPAPPAAARPAPEPAPPAPVWTPWSGSAAGTPLGDPSVAAGPARPAFLAGPRFALLRPRDDASVGQILEALRLAGAEPTRLFRHPVDLAAVAAYLAGPGQRDALVIPHFLRDRQTGLELVAALHAGGGAPRRILVPIVGAPPASADAVRAEVRRLLGPDARRVLVVTHEELVDLSAVPRIGAHLRDARP